MKVQKAQPARPALSTLLPVKANATKSAPKAGSNQLYLIGPHAVEAALVKHPEQLKELWLAPHIKLTAQQLTNLTLAGVAVQRADSNLLDRLSGYSRHQGWVARVTKNQLGSEEDLPSLIAAKGEQLTLLVLDQLQDPHNLGACLRSANAFKVDAVIIPRHRACGITPVVTKTAAGAVGSTPIIAVSNLARSLQLLKQQGIWLYGAEAHGETSLGELVFNQPLALVYGSEGRGLRHLVKKQCDQQFRIPMLGEEVSCLNVSVAVGIGLYELRRQQSVR